MALGRLTSAALSGTIDTTIALAAVNFDFSLVKIEARKEYEDIGVCLSRNRSDEAERGETHVTARKLGALFADVIPSTAHLFRAYGSRASEIARSLTHNPRGSKHDGILPIILEPMVLPSRQRLRRGMRRLLFISLHVCLHGYGPLQKPRPFGWS